MSPFGLFAMGEALAAAEWRAPSGLLSASGVVAPAGSVVSADVSRPVCGGRSVTSGSSTAGNVSVAIAGTVVVANGATAVDAMASVEAEPSPAGSASFPPSVSSHAEASDSSSVGWVSSDVKAVISSPTVVMPVSVSVLLVRFACNESLMNGVMVGDGPPKLKAGKKADVDVKEKGP